MLFVALVAVVAVVALVAVVTLVAGALVYQKESQQGCSKY